MKGKRSVRYKTGTKRSVIIQACTYAIRDQEALVDAYKSGCRWVGPDAETQGAINDAKELIADLERLRAVVRNS